MRTTTKYNFDNIACALKDPSSGAEKKQIPQKNQKTMLPISKKERDKDKKIEIDGLIWKLVKRLQPQLQIKYAHH